MRESNRFGKPTVEGRRIHELAVVYGGAGLEQDGQVMQDYRGWATDSASELATTPEDRDRSPDFEFEIEW